MTPKEFISAATTWAKPMQGLIHDNDQFHLFEYATPEEGRDANKKIRETFSMLHSLDNPADILATFTKTGRMADFGTAFRENGKLLLIRTSGDEAHRVIRTNLGRPKYMMKAGELDLT